MESNDWIVAAVAAAGSLLSAVIGGALSVGGTWLVDARRRRHEKEELRLERLRQAAMSANERLSTLQARLDGEDRPIRVDVKQEVRSIFLLVSSWVEEWGPVRDESDKVAGALETGIRIRMWNRHLLGTAMTRLSEKILGVSTRSTDFPISPAIREYFIELARCPEGESEALQSLMAERENVDVEQARRIGEMSSLSDPVESPRSHE